MSKYSLFFSTYRKVNVHKIFKKTKNGKQKFDLVIIWKLDRFARNRYDSARYKNTLKKNNVRVVSATETISQNAEGILLKSML